MKLTLKPSVNNNDFSCVVVAGDPGKFVTGPENLLLIAMREAYWHEFRRLVPKVTPGVFYFLTEEEGLMFMLRWGGGHATV